MRGCRPSITILAVGLVLAGCGNRRVRPSAAEYPEATLRETLRIDGTASGLAPIHTLAVAADGSIAVPQRDDGAIRFFGPEGEDQGSFGRQGEGPGEFGRLGNLGWSGDTLLAFDPQLSRVTLISPRHTLVRTIRFATTARIDSGSAGPATEFAFVAAFALEADGSLLALLQPAVGSDVPAVYLHNLTTAHITSDGTVRSIVALLPFDAPITLTERGRFVALYSPPFANRTLDAYAPGLGRLAMARAAIDDPRAVTVHVTVVKADGDTLLDGRYPIEALPLPGAAADSVIERTIGRLARVKPGLAAQYRRQVHVPPVYPPLHDLVYGRDGTLWIALKSRGDRRPLLAIAPDGQPRGRVLLPPRSELAAADGNRIWTLERNQDDVESVVRYDVSWPAGGR